MLETPFRASSTMSLVIVNPSEQHADGGWYLKARPEVADVFLSVKYGFVEFEPYYGEPLGNNMSTNVDYL